MPKLKFALQAHQANAARHAAKVQAAERAAETYKSKSHPGTKKKRLNDLKSALNGPSSSTASSSTPLSNGVDSKGKAKAGPTRKPTIPFDGSDTILLLGEANFSFAASLLLPPHEFSGCQICATSYDSEEVCYEKYADARELVGRLRGAGVKVLFGVDAGDLPKEITGSKARVKGKKRMLEELDHGYRGDKEGGKWSRVVFNFPHAGAGITDQDRNILSNQHLLLRTLQAVYPILTSGSSHTLPDPPSKKRKSADLDEEEDPLDLPPDLEALDEDEDEDEDEGLYAIPKSTTFTPPSKEGTFLVTLLDQNPYTLWNLPKLATKPPPTTPGTQLPQPRYKLLRSFEFRPEVYEGYAHRRTIGFKEGLSKAGNEEIVGRKGKARTWEFGRLPRKGRR